ncbi:hypothetical protein M378DRAFT_162275 [Amanita muscaria Koide BX008]|uniref:Uncharacterized protein n=1 Tax=Amanita muscaria (strain Koide BX008) TaxID=946122 RepID=A0A0C2X973_AMAMK|nr:hypothetical protein M378DRAFT_162275 [Amanita muscaria Koide BX008]
MGIHLRVQSQNSGGFAAFLQSNYSNVFPPCRCLTIEDKYAPLFFPIIQIIQTGALH